ncbi:hypothetical protein [Streptomyces sp. XD-27]|uniref:hypothetical protein n=1 Tax=Streptomyces sp. XD-27 TaxID=3062779 RepID=UPI0026F41206|nr:hypothetical protein [Streptomyces sp. XD-27]WKX71945.1 hypothetical protein Q3Y56_20400 [Streptomyces sp. XD-27]
MRKAAQITGAALFAAVLVTGCSSSDDDGKGDKNSPTTGGQSNAPAGGGDTGGTASGLYTAKSGGQPVNLMINDGKAVLSSPHACTGTYANNMLTLKCVGGNTDRTVGKVTVSDGGKTLKVHWNGLSEDDTFTQVGPVPSDMPTIPTGMPTGIPDSAGGIG